MIRIILFLLLFSGLSFGETIIRFSHVVSEDSPKGIAIKFFKNEVEKLSEGKIKVQIYPQGILFDDIPVLDAVKMNVVQMAAPSFSKFSDKVPDFQVFDIPYLFKDKNSIHNFYKSTAIRILYEETEKLGIKILDFWDNDFKQITCRNRLIKSPSDMKGLKIRTMGSQVLNKQFILMGGKPFTYPFSSVKNLLAEKIVDCQENTFNNIYSQKLHLYQKNMTISNHGYLGYAVIISKRFWDSLGQEDKKVILNALKESTRLELTLSFEKNYSDYYKLKRDKKLQIYELNNQEILEWEKFFKKNYNIFLNELSDQMRNELKKMGLI